jgi:hypothetical protein
MVGMLVLGGLAGSASATYITFIGQNNNPVTPDGSLTSAGNWDGGALPSGSSTGLVAAARNVWISSTIKFPLRQTAGYIYSTASSTLGEYALYEIEDSRTDYASYTNLYIPGVFTLWSSLTESMSLSVLSGHVEVGELKLLEARDRSIINMKNGLLHVGVFSDRQGTFNMLAGGTGEVVVDSITADRVYLNFETGNQGSFTLGSVNSTNGAAGFWESMRTSSYLSIDGVASTSPSDFIISTDGLSSTISLSPYRNYPKFIGQYNNPDAPVGSITVDANWEGGVKPVGSTTGLVSATANVWWASPMTDFALLQVDGMTFAAGDGNFGMNGGSSGTSNTSLYVINDADTNYGSYTNLHVPGKMTLWSRYDNAMELDVLSGRVEAGSLMAISGIAVSNFAPQATIRMRDGLMHAGTLSGGPTNSARGYVEVKLEMLSGGTGELVFDAIDCSEVDAYLTPNFPVNFETGNAGSITFGSKLTTGGTGSAAGIWAAMIANGQLSIDGSVVTDSSLFTITQAGFSSTLKLDDGSTQTSTEAYNSWISGFAVADTSMTVDSDGDGLSNLAEYGQGGNPDDADDRGYVSETSVIEETGTNWFYYVHYELLDKGGLGLTYTPEAGTGLIVTNWNSSALEWVGNGAGPAGFNAVTNRISMETEDAQFIQLKIELAD